MKVFKRLGTSVFIFCLSVVLFRGTLYRAFVDYQSIGSRTCYSATEPQLIQYIEENAGFAQQPDAEDILERALFLTSRKLRFTAANNPADPNQLFHSQVAHCVGYATFFTTVANYLFQQYHIQDIWIAEAQRGQLYFLGKNVHPYISTPFFRNHDFVIIRNKSTGQRIAVDPSVNDYLAIRHVSIR